MDRPLDLFKAETLVKLLATCIVNLGIRGELIATVRAGKLCSRLDQLRRHVVASFRTDDVNPFDECRRFFRGPRT